MNNLEALTLLGILGTGQDSAGGDPTGDALRADCVAYWKMDEASGQNLTDATGRGNTLTETGGAVDSVAGLVGNAKNFQGDGKYFKRADSADLRFTNSWAMSFFINLTVDTAFKVIVNKGDPNDEATEASVYIGNSDGMLSAYSDDLSQSVAVSTLASAISVSAWHLITVEFNNVTKRLAVSLDGGAKTLGDPNASFNPFSAANPFLVGVWLDEADQSLNAKLQHLAKYSRVLTTDEIAYLYNSGSGRSLY